MIIDRDIFKFLEINLRFSDETAEWDGITTSMPFKDGDPSIQDAYHMSDSDQVTSRVTKILDTKYAKTDLRSWKESYSTLRLWLKEAAALSVG